MSCSRCGGVTTRTRGWWRDGDGPVGLGICLDTAATDPRIVAADPVAAAIADDLRARPVDPDDRTLTIRHQLSVGSAGPTPADGALIVDYKRHYLRLRPHLQRTYTTVEDPRQWLPLLARWVSGHCARSRCRGATLTLAVLEFGEGSVDGWLARLVATG